MRRIIAMKKNIFGVGAGVATLSMGLIALPSPSAPIQEQGDASATIRVQRLPKVRELQRVQIDGDRIAHDVDHALEQSEGVLAGMPVLVDPEIQQVTILDGDEGPSWLGVETHEVTPEDAKNLKLSAERGVVVAGVTEDSPAAKAGLKEKDVITEVNGQRVEGAAQFRRIIHEIPAGRTAQLSVWRDGRAQTLSATLGKAEERHNTWTGASPEAFAFHMPNFQMPDMPSVDVGEMAMIGVLRNKSEVTLSVELPARTPKARKLTQRTNI